MKAGISVSHLEYIEQSKHQPRPATHYKLAQALGLPHDYFDPTPTDQKNLGERIQEARILAGLTQKQLAKIANVSVSDLGAIEQNKRQPRPATRYKLAQALGLPHDYFDPTPTDQKNLGERIQEARILAGLTQKQLLKIANVSTQLEYIEQNKRQPKPATRYKLAQALGLPHDYFDPTPTDQKNLGERIQEARILAGLTQKQLAKIANISTTWVHNIETNNTQPKTIFLVRVAQALGFHHYHFVDDAPPSHEMTLGQRIQEARYIQGLTAKQVADQVGGIVGQTILDYEKDKFTPTPKVLKRIKKLLKISIDDLPDRGEVEQPHISEQPRPATTLTQKPENSTRYLKALNCPQSGTKWQNQYLTSIKAKDLLTLDIHTGEYYKSISRKDIIRFVNLFLTLKTSSMLTVVNAGSNILVNCRQTITPTALDDNEDFVKIPTDQPFYLLGGEVEVAAWKQLMADSQHREELGDTSIPLTVVSGLTETEELGVSEQLRHQKSKETVDTTKEQQQICKEIKRLRERATELETIVVF